MKNSLSAQKHSMLVLFGFLLSLVAGAQTNGIVNQVRVDPDFKPDCPVGSGPVCVQPDGKILVVSPAEFLTGEDGVLVLRLLQDGRRDPAWKPPLLNGVGSFALQTNGQMLVVSRLVDSMVNGIPYGRLTRLNVDGSIDSDFVPELPAGGDLTSVAVQNNGQILVGSHAVCSNGGVIYFCSNTVYRLNSSGTQDPAFQHASVGNNPQVYALPDGWTIIATMWPSEPLIRLNPDGSLDEQFKPLMLDRELEAILPDGKLLAGFWTNGSFTLGRFAGNGQIDAVYELDNAYWPVLPTSQGKVWAYSETGSGNFRLRRFNPNGTQDETWPTATVWGLFTIATPAKLMELPDGNLLLVGIPGPLINGQTHRGFARLLVDAPLPRFEVDPATARVMENAGTVSVKILRCGANTEALSISWQTEGGTARPGTDYLPAQGTLLFPANESAAHLELQLLDNSVADDDRTVRFHLRGSPPDYRDYPVVEITIVNDDPGFPPGSFQRFPNGRVLLRPTGYLRGRSLEFGVFEGLPGDATIEFSDNLRDWTEFGYVCGGVPEVVDKAAPAHCAGFYRLTHK